MTFTDYLGEKVIVLLPVHNRRDITQNFVRCLMDQIYRNYHLVLIDDGSTDGTEEMVRRHVKALTVIKGDGNWWWAGSLQQGYKWLKNQDCSPADVVLIMNDDTEFESDFLEKGLRILSSRPNTLLLAECYSQTSRALRDKGVYADWEHMRFERAETPEKINCLSTMGLFLRVEDLFKIGGFYPRLLPHFTSDYEFTMRAHRKGFTLITDPSIKLWLNEETTWNRDMGDEPFLIFARKLFSKKSPINPLIWTSFIALACPWRYKILNWYRIWGSSLLLLRKSALETIARKRRRQKGEAELGQQ